MVNCCYYTRVDIYIKIESTHPTHPNSPLTPLFPVFPVSLTPLTPSNKPLNITYTPLLQYILYIYYSYTISFTYNPQISILNPFNHPINLHYYNPNKNRSERKPELPSFTINHFSILIINFSLRLLHPTVAVDRFRYKHIIK